MGGISNIMAAIRNRLKPGNRRSDVDKKFQKHGRGDDKGNDADIDKAMEAAPESSRPIRELGYYYLKKDLLQEAERWLLLAAWSGDGPGSTTSPGSWGGAN